MLSATVRGRGAVRAAGAVAVVAALTVALSSCGGEIQYGLGGESSSATLPLVPSKPVGDPTRYDLIVLASAENNPLFSDVYGVTLNPLEVTRITEDKRVSAVDADESTIVVAAADGRTDRLAIVDGDGELAPIPGLGRPFAYSPVLTDDGDFYYSDFKVVGGNDVDRFWRWDAGKSERQQVLRSSLDVVGPILGSGPKGRLGFVVDPGTASNAIAIGGLSGTGSQRFPVEGIMATTLWGKDFVAATIDGEGSSFGNRPAGLLLLNAKSGKQTRVPGYQAVAWSPDGTKLLVRSTDDLGSSVLSLLDPKDPSSMESVGTIPGLAIYSGAWVGPSR